MHAMPRPIVLFSRCLGFDHCRYNGGIVNEPAVEILKPHVETITVCPEMAVGLGVPRSPIRLIGPPDAARLVQPESGLDLTDSMRRFAEEHVASLPGLDGAILKYASPSCGPREVKIYASEMRGSAFSRTSGAYGGTVVERFPDLPIEDEGRLKNYEIRQHFLTRLFALARFRSQVEGGSMRDLVAFQAENKLLLMAYNQTALRELGRLVANPDRRSFADLVSDYRTHLSLALSRAPRRTSAVNVLQHAFGYVSDRLTRQERNFFLDSLDRYRDRRMPLSAPTAVLRAWIVRFEEEYLSAQTFFEPYPDELIELLDSGKGRPLG